MVNKEPADQEEQPDHMAPLVPRETRVSLVLKELRATRAPLVLLVHEDPLVLQETTEDEVNKVPPVPQDLTVSLETLAPLVHLDHRDLMGERETKDILVLLDPLDPLVPLVIAVAVLSAPQENTSISECLEMKRLNMDHQTIQLSPASTSPLTTQT